MNTYQGQLDEHSKEKKHVGWSSLEGEAMEESLDKSPFSSTSMSMADRDTKTGWTAFPQQVPWSNANEARQEGRKLGVKGVDVMEDQGLKDRNMVSSSRVQAAGTPPVESGAPDLSLQGHLNDVRGHGATNSSRQGHHNGGPVPETTNSRRQGHHMDERVPGAVVVPGFDGEAISRYDDDQDQSHANDRRHSEDRTDESNENSTHAITARVVDTEEEHRVLREQLHQALREEREHAVVHTATIARGVEHGNKAVVQAAANDYDGDVERGNMTLRQAPTININASVQQASINSDHPKIVGFWHGTRGRLVIAALILVIVATAVGVTLAIVLGEETPQSDQLNGTTNSAPGSTIDPTSQPATSEPTGESTFEPTSAITSEQTPDTTSPSTPPPVNTTTPTPPASPVDNDICSNAWPNPVDGTIYAGSNVNGKYVLACATSSDGPGAWYKFIGTGRPIKVSTCNKNTTELPTALSVLSSTDGTCNKSECVMTATGGGSTYYSACPAEVGSTGSTASVPSELGLTYYASVIGYAGEVGEFGLTIFDDSVGCEDDKEPHPVDGTIYAGSNVNGKYVSACATDSYGPGAWYRFIGTGRPIKVSTCNKNTTELPTALSLFSSTDGTCNKSVCEMTATGGGSTYYSACPADAGSTGSTASVLTEPDSVYYASVIGYAGEVGKFGLTIFDDSVGCEDVKDDHPVDGTIYAGSNVNGKYVSACATDSYGPGAWYRFIGTGRPIKVSTCNKNTTELATVLSVFSSTDGTCNKLVCEMTATGGGSTYYSACPAEVGSTGSTASIPTELGSTYYASVIGYDGAVGEFGLTIFDDSPARGRILPEVLAPAFVKEVISDRITIN